MNWLKYRKINFAVSLVAVAVSIYGLLVWGLKMGVDFDGGSFIEYKFPRAFPAEEVVSELESENIEVTSIQETGDLTYLFKFPPLESEEKEKVASIAAGLFIGENEGAKATNSTILEELRFENVGPSVGPELVKKTLYAILIAACGILLWVAYQFRSINYGLSAIFAMFHDSFILIGSFSLLGHFFGAEVDFLFVTALLTTLSFSVHDTIVVFDRIREIKHKEGGELYQVANKALTETMVRSLNNSFTIAFMLLALMLLGGATVKWFAAALFIGTALGTYSSPFVAVPLLVMGESFGKRLKGMSRK